MCGLFGWSCMRNRALEDDWAIPQSRIMHLSNMQFKVNISLHLLPSRNRLMRPPTQMLRCESRIPQNRPKSEDVARTES